MKLIHDERCAECGTQSATLIAFHRPGGICWDCCVNGLRLLRSGLMAITIEAAIHEQRAHWDAVVRELERTCPCPMCQLSRQDQEAAANARIARRLANPNDDLNTGRKL